MFDNQYQCTQNIKHNVTTAEIGVGGEEYAMDISTQTCKTNTSGADVSQQTCNLSTSTVTSQTDPVIHRKSQTRNFNNCTRRIQTIPIAHLNMSTQSETLNCNSVETMTIITEVADAASHIPVIESRHSQTLLIEMDDKYTTMDKISVLSPKDNTCIPPNCKSARIQTDSPLTYLGNRETIRGTPYSDVWVQSAADFLMDNAAVLATMKESINDLKQSCSQINDGVT